MTMKSHVTYLSVFFVVYFDIFCNGQTVNQTKTLISTVLKSYDHRIRPTLNQSLPTKVNVTFNILGLKEVSEVESWFSIIGYLSLSWIDELLSWNPDSHGGIQSFVFQNTDVWFSQLALTHPVDTFEFKYDECFKVHMNFEGHAEITPGTAFKSICDVDVSQFPFDKQICHIGFISLDYSIEDLLLITPNLYAIGVPGHFIEHGEWSIVENSTDNVRTRNNNYILFNFHLKKKPTYFVVNIIKPIFVLSMLNILIFVLPPQSGERVSFGITVLLAFAVFLSIVGENLPKASKNMSILSYYLTTNLNLSALMCVLAILNLRIYFKEKEERFPWWAKCVVLLTCPSKKASHRYEAKKKSITDGEIKQEISIEDDYRFTWIDISLLLDKLFLLSFFIFEMSSLVILLILLTKD